MDMKAMDRISDMMCHEVEDIAKKGKLDMADLEIAHKAISTIKNIEKIRMMDDGGQYGQSGGYGNSRGSYNGGNNGMSYGNDSYRGGRHWVSGHYSRADGFQELRDRMRNSLQSDNLSMEDRMLVERALNMME